MAGVNYKNTIGNDSNGPKIITDIEGGNIQNVIRHSENHFSMQIRPDIPSVYPYPDHHLYWFYFKMEDVKGKEIRLDIARCDWMRRHWTKYKPVFSYAKDPDNLNGVRWYRIEKTKRKRNTFSFVQAFEKNFAWVALRYPYNYTRAKRYIESIRDNKYVAIEELGRTAMNNSFYMVVITEKHIPLDKKPGILVYAREHGAEQDGSWVVEGMINHLLSTDPSAAHLRENFFFMIIPILCPDASILGRAVDPLTGKSFGRELMKKQSDSIEAKLLYNRIERFVREGNPLDLCISFHNPHGTEPNIYPNYLTGGDKKRLQKAKRLNQAIFSNAVGYTKWKEFILKCDSYSVGRFARDFGSLSILYEVNHQAKGNYLSLEKLKAMGKVFIKGIADYYRI